MQAMIMCQFINRLSRKNGCVVIPYNVRCEGEATAFDEYFRPTCGQEHSYRYDSFDEQCRTLKFTLLKNVQRALSTKKPCDKTYSKQSVRQLFISIRI